MDTLDIILINTISYMSGIFTGLVISYKLRSNKNCNKVFFIYALLFCGSFSVGFIATFS